MSDFSKELMTQAVLSYLRDSDAGMAERVGDSGLPAGDRSQSGYLPVVTVYLVPGGNRWGPLYVEPDAENVDFVMRSAGVSPTSARKMADHVRKTFTSGEFPGYLGWSCLMVDLPGEPGGVDRDDEGEFAVFSVSETYRFFMSSR